MRQKSEAQQVCDVLMECLHHVHAGNAPKEREAMYEWVRGGLKSAGIEGGPVGSLHFLIRTRPPEPNPLVDEVQFLNSVLSGMEDRTKILGEIIKAQTAALALFTERPHIVTGLNRNG